MAFNTNLLKKKNEAIEVKRHRLSEVSRVTKLVSVGAGARSQPTYPVISHRRLGPPLPQPQGEQQGGECGLGSKPGGRRESKFVYQLSASLVIFFL